MSEASAIARGVRLVATYAREQRRPLVLAVTGSVVYAAGSVAGALALGTAVEWTIDRFFAGDDPRTLLAATLLVGIMIVRSAGVIARRFYAGMTAAGARADLQHRIADRLVAIPLERVQARPRGELLAHLDADTEAAVDVIHPMPFTVGVVTMLVFSIVSLAAIDIPLMLATLILLPIVLGLSIFNARVIQASTERERAANADVTTAATELIEGTQVVKTLGLEDHETARFTGIVDRHRRARIHYATIQLTIDSAFSLLPQLAMILIIAVGTLRVDSGALDPPALVQAVALFSVMAFPMQVIGFFLVDLPRSVVGRDRIETILAEPDDPLRIPEGPGTLPSTALGGELRGVAVGDPARPLLRHADLRIEPGETLAVVGATGSGKSTLLEALARLRPLREGGASLDGIAVDTIADDHLRRHVTFATQQAALFGGTVRESVDFGRGFPTEEVDLALERAGAGDLADVLPDGYETVIGERGVTLSGGQRQRVALARALVGDPGMVLLDDATAAVDPALEEQILATLAELPTTVVMVTHRVAAMAAADRVAFVEDGAVRAIGTHAELQGEPGYARLVAAYEFEALDA